MKKTLLVLVVSFFVFGSSAFAQLDFGVKAGLNIANISGDDVNNTDSKIGLVLGGFMTYQFADMFALQPELLYSMKGYTAEGGGVETTGTLNYIEIPVLIKFLIPIAGASTVKPALYAGPAIAFNAAAEVEQEFNGNSQTTDLDDEVSSVDFGLAMGGSVGFALGSGNELGFDLRYTLGLSSVDDSGMDLDVKNGVFSITAFFGF